MKALQHITRSILTLTIVLSGFMSDVQAANTFQKPDFDFPREVEANAYVALHQALREGNQHDIVLAAMQIGKSRIYISERNLGSALTVIDSVMQVGHLSPDYNAILYYYKSELLNRYANMWFSLEKGDDESDDITRWSSSRRDSLRDAFLDRALDPLGNGDISALMQPCTHYQGIVHPGDEWGQRCMPYLFDLLAEKKFSTLPSHPQSQRKDLRMQWLNVHAQDQSLYPRIYISYNTSDWNQQDIDSLIAQYRNQPEVGLLYTLHGSGMHRQTSYDDCQRYVAAYPRSPFTPYVQNQIDIWDIANVETEIHPCYTSRQDISVSVRFMDDNAAECKVTLYRMPDKLLNKFDKVRLSQLQYIDEVIVHHDSLGQQTCHASFPAQPYGVYFTTTSLRDDQGRWVCPKKYDDEYLNRASNHLFTVSDLRTFAVSTADTIDIFAINALDGAPQEGVTVEYSRYPELQFPMQGTTDLNGAVTGCDGSYYYYILHRGDDIYLNKLDRTNYARRKQFPQRWEPISAQIFTDLAIYRPGEKVRVTAILYQLGTTSRRLITDGKFYTLTLYDPNHKKLAAKSVTADDWGQLTEQFTLPTDRMNGTYRLELESPTGLRNSAIATHFIQVSEYKAPTFYVDLSGTPQGQSRSDSLLVIRGKALSYSGLPVSNGTIQCNLEASRMWFWGSNLGRHSGTATTDQEGNFEYRCPYGWIEDSSHSDAFRISVDVQCTDLAGETQTAHTSIRIGHSRRIQLDQTALLLPDTGLYPLPITYQSADTATTDVICRYTLTDAGSRQLVRQGTFPAQRPSVDWSAVPSGTYILSARVEGQPADNGFEREVILFRRSDRLAPRGVQGLWMPSALQQVTADGKAHIPVGAHSAFHLYYIAESRQGIVSRGWKHFAAGMHDLTLDMPAARDERLNVEVICYIDDRLSRQSATLLSPLRDEVKINVQSFRDHVAAGSRQQWTLRLTDAEGRPAQGRMLLDLYSKALEQLQSNQWQFAPDYLSTSFHYSSLHSYGRTYQYRSRYPLYGVIRRIMGIVPPEFNDTYALDYSMALCETVVVGSRSGRRSLGEALQGRIAGLSLKSSKRASRAAEVNTVYDDEEIKVAVSTADAAGNAVAQTTFDDIAVRSTQTHVALWRPTLTTDSAGIVQITFDMPSDNATWHLQALAFTRSLATDLWHTEVVAQRPVMVQPSLPRFLRAGDGTTLSANVQNASDSAIQASVLVELFDPRTEQVLDSRRQQVRLEPRGTQTVSISCTAPTAEPYIGFRIKAVDAQGNGDGEQQRIPVLPCVTPVIEGQPFFLASGTRSISFDVHRPAARQSRSVLMACSNPTWYCIEALPSVAQAPASTSTGIAHQLFALGVAGTLIEQQPHLPMVSQLYRNSDLKVGTLQASPWLRAADMQQERMQALGRLLNPTLNSADYNRLCGALRLMQMPDGGFLWCSNPHYLHSSYWATSAVVQLLGEMRLLGCRQGDPMLDDMLHRALQYLDHEVLDRLSDSKRWRERIDYLCFADYAYICTLFDQQRPYASAHIRQQTEQLRRKVLHAMEDDWRQVSLSDRAYCAITLHRSGRHEAAARIVESLSQLAVSDPERGMYWDRLPDGPWSHPVAHTAVILNAFSEIAPHQYASQIERIRQWLLLEKQTSDWGNSSLAADAVHALLRTGQDWVHDQPDSASTLRISINGRPLTYSPDNALLGNMRIDLPDSVRHIEVTSAQYHPAWGAVIHQYEAPMEQVQRQSVSELSIRKELWAQDRAGQWYRLSTSGKADLSIGQRVQVRLVVTCSKALEYLTLTDQRPACLEPVDQLSHYGWEDCIYYQETKDSQTNFFIQRLPKGVHVLTYDCHVTNTGSFALGIATIQSQYAPQFVAHSDGGKVKL
ncbi:MAG: hypothetical protein K6E86_03035 [Bacteroidales bacterium]|nr:hypothetical protein [Bacteroidales bacterium]